LAARWFHPFQLVAFILSMGQLPDMHTVRNAITATRDAMSKSAFPEDGPVAPDKAGMCHIPGGTFRMGSDIHYSEERPAHLVSVDAFWIDACPVANAQFSRFVAETGYRTVAERPLYPALYPGALPGTLVPGALVFHMTDGPVGTGDFSNWWRYVPGACWRHSRVR
jgi:formylglycine-generating enzyme required for sulfatase activity